MAGMVKDMESFYSVEENRMFEPIEKNSVKYRMRHFLMAVHAFEEETLNLLNFKNLKQLASDYGFNPKKW